MIFPSETVLEQRRKLWSRLDAGEPADRELWEKALEVDPNDAVALAFLGESHQDAGNEAEAERCYWRGLEANPCEYRFYMLLSQLLGRPDKAPALSLGLMELWLRKVTANDRVFEAFQRESKPPSRKRKKPLIDFSDRDDLGAAAAVLGKQRSSEPKEVTGRLYPYRLIQELEDGAGDGLSRKTADEVLKLGPEVRPLLEGVLRGWACGQLTPEASGVVEAAVALLGELGEPAALQALLEFTTLDNFGVSQSAKWAIGRITSRSPGESLGEIRKLIPGLETGERVMLAEQLASMPPVPGIGEAIVQLLDGFERQPKSERDNLFLMTVSALLGVQGRRGAELADHLLRRYSKLLKRDTRGVCQGLLEMAREGELPPMPRSESNISVYDICERGYPGEEEEEKDIADKGEEDVWTPPEPVRKAPQPGRNDPCWCGSGKKYKKCHLASDESGVAKHGSAEMGPRPLSFDPAHLGASLRKRIFEFAEKELSKRDLEKATERFFGGRAGGPLPDDAEKILFFDWLTHDFVSPRLGGGTVLEAYLERHAASLTVREQHILERWAAARYGLYEVQDKTEGTGVALKDLLTGDVIFVHDVSASRHLVKWDCVLCRVEEFEDRKELCGAALIVPRGQCEELKEWILKDHARTGLPWSAYLRDNSHCLRQRAFQMQAGFLDSLRVVSAEGDPLVFSKAFYQVLDEAALLKALDSARALEREGTSDGSEEKADRFAWLEEPESEEGPRRSLGSLTVDRGRLTLECSSRQRLERGKRLLEDLAGPALKSLGDQFEDLKTAMGKMKDSPRKAQKPPIPREVEFELVGKVLAEHYRKWPDHPLPALDGRTPREAVSSPKGKAEVEEILRFIENGEERKRLAGEPWFDVSRLRAELKM